MYEGETKANVTRLVPHGLTPYGPASDPQVGALLAVAELRLKSKGDPALAIRAPRCWEDPPGTLRRASSVVQITPQTRFYLFAALQYFIIVDFYMTYNLARQLDH